MTTYGFAIKALPKPFENDEEEDENDDEQSGASSDPTGAVDDAPEAASDRDRSVDQGASPDGPDQPLGEAADTPPTDETPAAQPPDDDSRPWAGDMYDEGDESDPADSFAAYTGSAGEEAWLDQAADGTLTGWVRDSTGQVWRYADADAWAIDVDDAQMTRSHGGDAPAEAAGPPAGEPGKQTSLFPPQ
ncbi:hypothetical protein AB0O57_29325 [Streptomyces sp. NPDC091201]|uniref:hypothetical protein n=1 Tax=Streptomyces sp. NPDC091201 TaxID=3155190 RepID=UPI0034150755